MSSTNNLHENVEFVMRKNMRVNSDQFIKYLTQNGKEKTEGYLEAIEDVVNIIEASFTKQSGNNYLMSTPAYIAKQTKLFFEENQIFLKSAKQLLLDNSKKSNPVTKDNLKI